MVAKSDAHRNALEAMIRHLDNYSRALEDEAARIRAMCRPLEDQLYSLYPEEDV